MTLEELGEALMPTIEDLAKAVEKILAQEEREEIIAAGEEYWKDKDPRLYISW